MRKERKKRNTNLACFGLRPVLIQVDNNNNNNNNSFIYPLFKIKIRLNYSHIDVKKTNFRYQPYLKKKPIKRLQKQQSKPNFNLQITDYVLNTTLYSKLFLQSHNLENLVNPEQLNIT